MPTLTAHACTFPGCARTDPHRHRDERTSAAKRGYGTRHRKWREMILNRDPICVLCNRRVAIVADHIIPLSRGGESSLENGQGLCKTCHDEKTFSECHAKPKA
jgi:5-methylcytosine-specific restriction protein A